MSASPLTAVARQLRGLLGRGGTQDLSDAQLLQRFAVGKEETAFAALVRRHGRLVWGVCRHVLGHEHDAEDAFQATFLVLARKAGSIRKNDSIAGWLHGTAYRVALRARRDAARRRRHEARLNSRASEEGHEAALRELQTILDEEVQRLPDRQRAVFVLCCLEGRGVTATAAELGWRQGTVAGTLARARRRLQHRLASRGVLLSAAVTASAVTAHSPLGAVPPPLVRATLEAVVAGQVSSSVIALVAGVTRTMLLNRLMKAVLATLLGLAVAGLGLWGGQALAGRSAEALAAQSGTTADEEKPRPKAPPAESPGKVECRGRVIDPDGKPVVGAQIRFVTGWSDRRGEWQTDRSPAVRADATGRFVLTCSPRTSEDQRRRNTSFQFSGMVLASAPGFGPGWVRVTSAAELASVTVRLVKDDVPLEGRVLDLEGKPIAGVGVRVILLRAAQGEDISGWLEKLTKTKVFSANGGPDRSLDLEAVALARTAQTGADGRFRLTGFGRDRLVVLRVEGETVEAGDVYVLTRVGPARAVVTDGSLSIRARTLTIHGAKFDHAAAPTRPIVGTVRDRDTGRPLASVTIRAPIPATFFFGDQHSSLRTTTDAAGRYRLVGLPAQPKLEVLAEAPAGQPYLAAGKQTPAAEGLAAVTLDFALQRGVWIKGRVTDRATGRPVPEVKVAYFSFSGNPFLQKYPEFRRSRPPEPYTAKDGSFTLIGLPGRGIVTAKVGRAVSDRYLTGVGADTIKGRGDRGDFITWPYIVEPRTHNVLREVNPDKDDTAITRDLALDPGKTIEGVVVGPDGKPAGGVEIQGTWGMDGWRGPADADGKFRLRAIDPKHPRAFFFRDRKNRLGAAVLIKGDEPAGFTVKLQPCGVITGRLLDPDGAPLADRYLSGYIEDNQKAFHIVRGWGGMFGAATGKDGRFRAEGIIPGLQVGAYLQLRPAFLGDKVFQRITLKPGQTHDIGDFKVRPRTE